MKLSGAIDVQLRSGALSKQGSSPEFYPYNNKQTRVQQQRKRMIMTELLMSWLWNIFRVWEDAQCEMLKKIRCKTSQYNKHYLNLSPITHTHAFMVLLNNLRTSYIMTMGTALAPRPQTGVPCSVLIPAKLYQVWNLFQDYSHHKFPVEESNTPTSPVLRCRALYRKTPPTHETACLYTITEDRATPSRDSSAPKQNYSQKTELS